MIRVTGYASDLHASWPVRLDKPAREINKQHPNHDVVVKTTVDISDFYRSNVMVWQRASERNLLPKLQLAKQLGIKSIYEVDDDLFNIPEAFQKPYIHHSKPEVRAAILEFMQNCDALTVSTHTLAHALRPHVPDKPVFVVENTLDVDRWEEAFSKRSNDGKVVIGWMASGSHTIDAPLVMPALLRALQEDERVHILLIGWVGWKQMCDMFKPYADRVTTMEWVDYVQLPMVMKDIDIGIAPLVDNLFNRSKSNLKWLQYSALGAATVASDLDPYKDIQNGTDGILVAETASEWADVVSGLVSDDDKRKRIGNAARANMLANWDMRKRAGEWTTVYDAVCQ